MPCNFHPVPFWYAALLVAVFMCSVLLDVRIVLLLVVIPPGDCTTQPRQGSRWSPGRPSGSRPGGPRFGGRLRRLVFSGCREASSPGTPRRSMPGGTARSREALPKGIGLSDASQNICSTFLLTGMYSVPLSMTRLESIRGVQEDCI